MRFFGIFFTALFIATASYAQGILDLIPNSEIRKQGVVCAPYQGIYDLLTNEGLNQSILFSSTGPIVDYAIINGREQAMPIQGVYAVWVNQNNGTATMTFTDQNGYTCIQATMSNFAPYVD